MQKNVGGLDRTARVLVGGVLAIAGLAALLGYWAAGLTVAAFALVLAVILLVTGTTQKCPLNELAGIDTNE